jgi:HPt (histidine-containing phosphotransfer) domain-containing protein
MTKQISRDVRHSDRAGAWQRPIDLKYLSSQTGGDRALEMEVLSMFLEVAPACLKDIESAPSTEYRKRPAHMLKGAARALGAFELADWAARAELHGFDELQALGGEVERVCRYIRRLTGVRP